MGGLEKEAAEEFRKIEQIFVCDVIKNWCYYH